MFQVTFRGNGTHSMDVTFSNVLEGTRQYFMGLPKQAQADGSAPPAWSTVAPPLEESAPAQSGAPTPSSRPPSAAAAPLTNTVPVPPRPPSEPIEPEPHIIHKATVMREAAEKRREQPEPEDEEEAVDAHSPPSHIIRKPPPRALPSPAPAPAAPCPSPARPPSAAPLQLPAPEPHDSTQYRPPVHRVQTPTSRPPEHYAPGRPPDPYSASRPPESYPRYHYETTLPDGGRNSRGPPIASPQPSVPPRHSPQTYARLSSTMPQHTTSRLRETAVHSPPAQRYAMPAAQQPPPPTNDRVPPIHHPQTPQRVNPVDSRSAQYPPISQRRESPYGRSAPHYERHPQLPQRKYDPKQAYPGYRPTPTAPQSGQSHRVELLHQVQYKHATMEASGTHYSTRPMDRSPVPPQPYPHDPSRLPHDVPRRTDYPNMNRSIDGRSNYHYPTPSTSSVLYAPTAPTAAAPVVQSSTLPSRAIHRSATAPKLNHEYPTSNQVQPSPTRAAVKPGYPNQQARMTVSVTTLVNQMNQTKQKRESPLDLSVKTVKNSADSSTTQDDMVDSAMENKNLPLQPRSSSSTRHALVAPGFVESHKVDFAPDFTQYRDRNAAHSYSTELQPGHHPVRYNGSYEVPRQAPEPVAYPVESRHHGYPERNKYTLPVARPEYVPRIDLTRPVSDERRPENRIRDDRHFIIEERKRPAGPIVSNIPEKIVRYETWTADSRLDRLSQSAREQHELISRPVYSYSCHKQFEAYQNEQKRATASNVYREHHPHTNHRYPYPTELLPNERGDYHAHYHDRSSSGTNRHVIQKIPSHRDTHPHHIDPHSGVPADKRVLSILRNSLETKQTGLVEPSRTARPTPDLIVIDDVDDSVIEITDLTKDNDVVESYRSVPKPVCNQIVPNMEHHIQMPKAVDSLPRDSDYQRIDSSDPKSKSPENDVASRIRTKAELKVLPPSQDSSIRPDLKQDENSENSEYKLLPKSQKQHLFNQIRQDLRLESVIKSENSSETRIPVKSEPMNIDEIEKDAVVPIKTEHILQSLEPENVENFSNIPAEEDLDWASACDSFMEQLKTGTHKKKSHRKRLDTIERDSDNRLEKKIPKKEPTDNTPETVLSTPSTSADATTTLPTSSEPITPMTVIVKQEPIDEEDMIGEVETSLSMISEITDKTQLAPEQNKIPILQDTQNNTENVVESKTLPTVQDSKLDTTLLSEPEPSVMEKDTNKIKKSSVSAEGKEQRKNKKSLSLQEEKEKSEAKIRKSSSVLIEKDKHQTKMRKSSSNHANEKDMILETLKTSEVSSKKDKNEKNKLGKKKEKTNDKSNKDKLQAKAKVKVEKDDLALTTKNDIKEKEPMKVVVKEELESTDDDEPLIKSKMLKEKEMKYQLLKDLSEKSAYVKLECFDVDMNKNTRISIDSLTKDKDEKQSKGKSTRQSSRTKGKSISIENIKTETPNDESSSDSDDENLNVAIASRLRVRKSIKTEDKMLQNKTPVKSSPSKKQDNSSASSSSTPVRKPGFGDGSDFHPGWEEELYKYKRSLRMPTRLIAIPRGRSGGPFAKGSGTLFTRGSTSLPDLDPAPLSPAPSSAPSAATDDLYARRPDKQNLDSDLESNSSSSILNRLQYDSEASTSTVFSSNVKKKSSSIVDVLIQKCGKKDDSKKKFLKDKDELNKTPKIIPKCTNPNELLATPSLGLLKNGEKGKLSAKKEKLMEDIFYLGAFRKETVTAFRNAFIKNTDGLIGATEEFAPVVLKSRTRTESRVLKQRATIKEVFGDERPASAPPTSCREDDPQEEAMIVDVKKEPVPESDHESKTKMKAKKMLKDKLKRRSSSIRDGLRSTKSLKRNDAKGRLLRLKKRNSLMKSLPNKRMKELSGNKLKKEKIDNTAEDKDKSKEEGSSPGTVEGNTKRRLKRLFGRRKFSSGFDYIRKKKKIIRREDTPNNKIRRPAVKPSPESVHDIKKEIKGWFINKSIGETHLHRAARLGYTVGIFVYGNPVFARTLPSNV